MPEHRVVGQRVAAADGLVVSGKEPALGGVGSEFSSLSIERDDLILWIENENLFAGTPFEGNASGPSGLGVAHIDQKHSGDADCTNDVGPE